MVVSECWASGLGVLEAKGSVIGYQQNRILAGGTV